jgi:hypothetical protein
VVFGKHYDDIFYHWLFYSNDNRTFQDERKVQRKKKCEK